MKENDLRRDREHNYKCGTGRSPMTLQGRADHSSQSGTGEGINGNDLVDARDWA